MKPKTFRDMHLLDAISQSPNITQRTLSHRIGVALGLTNLMLRRLATKGYIKISGTKRSRIRYLITPKGILEKTRLTYEYIQYSLQLYGGVRQFLHERLATLARAGHRNILLCGTDEMAEVAFLTAREMGLDIVGVIDPAPAHRIFLGYPVQHLHEAATMVFDDIVVTSLQGQTDLVQQLLGFGLPAERLISFPQPGAPLVGTTPPRSHAPPAATTPVLAPAMTDVVILCGGRGSRLGSLTDARPKPLLPVGDRPFLLHLLLRMKQEGFTRFILAAHYCAEQFEAFLSTYGELVPTTQLVVEPEPLGTGGALRYAADSVRSATFLVVNGDSWVWQPLAPVLAQHAQARRDCTVVAVQASQVEGGALKKGVWRIGPAGEVLGFETQESATEGWVNAGIYVLDRTLVSSWPNGSYSLEANLPTLLSRHATGLFCSPGRLLDIGTPDCYEGAGRFLESTEALIPAETGVAAHGK